MSCHFRFLPYGEVTHLTSYVRCDWGSCHLAVRICDHPHNEQMLSRSGADTLFLWSVKPRYGFTAPDALLWLHSVLGVTSKPEHFKGRKVPSDQSFSHSTNIPTVPPVVCRGSSLISV